MSTSKQKPIIITGLSGAGLSSVLKTLEDFGFEVFDNFPLTLIPDLVKDVHRSKTNIALGIDTRTRGFTPDAVLQSVEHHNAQLVYITCDDNVLQKRFTETRRKHPLTHNEPIHQGIQKERDLLQPLKSRANLTIDTTHLSIHDLRHILEGHFESPQKNTLNISVLSFGFRNGLPREADIVMDVRFLKNPHWDKNLRPKTGLSPEVGDYIATDPEFETFIQNFKNLIKPLIPRYTQEGKHYLTIAVGCTGGKHRSVFTAELITAWLKSINHTAHIIHRDLKD